MKNEKAVIAPFSFLIYHFSCAFAIKLCNNRLLGPNKMSYLCLAFFSFVAAHLILSAQTH